MRKNIETVLRAFAQGHSAVGDSKKTCSTNGETVFSYRMPIARREHGVIYIVPYHMAPTATTRSQVRAAQVFFRGNYIESPSLSGEGLIEEAHKAVHGYGSRTRRSRVSRVSRALRRRR